MSGSIVIRDYLWKTSPKPIVRDTMASAAARLRLKYMVGVKGRLIQRDATTIKTLTTKVRAQKKIKTGVQILYNSMTAWVLFSSTSNSSEMAVQLSLPKSGLSIRLKHSSWTWLPSNNQRHNHLSPFDSRWLDNRGDGVELNPISIRRFTILFWAKPVIKTNSIFFRIGLIIIKSYSLLQSTRPLFKIFVPSSFQLGYINRFRFCNERII